MARLIAKLLVNLILKLCLLCIQHLQKLYKKALESGFSTPEMDISTDHSGSLRTYRVRCSPIRPLGYPEDILDITSEDVTHKVVPQSEHSQLSDGFGEPSSNFIEPTGNFLFETLVSKRALRQRGSLNYLTIRSWRSSIKEHQIKAMRAIKQSAHFDFALKCAKECAAEIVSLVGVNTYKFVIPIPCGHSKPGKCLSLSLAKAIGAELSIPVIDAFAHQPLKGTSHPKTNLKRPPLRLTQHVPGPAIWLMTWRRRVRILKKRLHCCAAQVWMFSRLPGLVGIQHDKF